MNLSSKKLNIDYALLQMSYWVTSAVLFCFTTIFLQFKGYSNYEIGIVFAVGNIIGFIAQPLIAGLVDKSQKRILLRCICITSILSALLMLAVCLLPSGSVTIMGAYALLIAGSTLLNPLCISLSFYVESWGSSVNFSRARSGTCNGDDNPRQHICKLHRRSAAGYLNAKVYTAYRRDSIRRRHAHHARRNTNDRELNSLH